METFTYRTKGVCSTKFEFVFAGDVIQSLKVTGGCDGNLKGISSLVANRPIDEVIKALEGITCGFKKTSCPDQIAMALKMYKEQADAVKG